MDHGAQLKTKDLAQLSQVGQAAGSEGAVRISDSSQESVNQPVSVLEEQISCKEEEKEGPGDGSSACSWLWEGTCKGGEPIGGASLGTAEQAAGEGPQPERQGPAQDEPGGSRSAVCEQA